MDEAAPQVMEEAESPRDLRAELFGDLSTQFAAALEDDGSLPAAAQKALVKLLDSDAPTAAEIIAAASKSDPLKKGAGDE
jgi:hypothetical protein